MAVKRRVLGIIENNDLRQIILEQFQLEKDLLIIGTKTLEEAIALFTSRTFDLVVADFRDLMFGGDQKYKTFFCSAGVFPPLIFILDPNMEQKEVERSFEGRATILYRPISINSLLAAVWTSIRRYENEHFSNISLGRYSFTLSENVLVDSHTKKTIKLTSKESAIIKLLLLSDGRPISKETLLDEIWGYSSGISTHTLETHIYSLRRKMEHQTSKSSPLETVEGGYRLVF